MKICIDCDPGVDDSLAILFALARPDVEVVGISTSCLLYTSCMDRLW